MQLFRSRKLINRLQKNDCYQDLLASPNNMSLRQAFVGELDKQSPSLANLVRSQQTLGDPKRTKEEFAKALRTQWELFRDSATEMFPSDTQLVWDWPWPNLTWTNSNEVLKPSFGEQIIPGVVWQYTDGLPDALGISANELADSGTYIFSTYPIRSLAVSFVTSGPILKAVKDRGVLYETDEGWGRLEDVLEFSGLQQIVNFSIEGAHLEVQDISRIVGNEKLQNVEELTLMVAPSAFAEACRQIANSRHLKNLRILEMFYKPHHEPESFSEAITDESLISFANSKLPRLEELRLWGESFRMHDPITARGITALLDADRFSGISLTTNEFNDETLSIVGQHKNSNRLKSLRLSWGVYSEAGIEGLATENNWENLERLDLFYPRSMVNFDLLPFAKSNCFPKLRVLHARNAEITPDTITLLPTGLPELTSLILDKPISPDANPEMVEQLFSKLEFLQMPLVNSELAELLSASHIFAHIPAFGTSLPLGSDVFKRIVDRCNASQLTYLDARVTGLYSSGQRSLDFSGTFADEFVNSSVGENLMTFVDSSDTPHPTFENRWGNMYLHTATNRELKRDLVNGVAGRRAALKPTQLYRLLSKLGIAPKNFFEKFQFRN